MSNDERYVRGPRHYVPRRVLTITPSIIRCPEQSRRTPATTLSSITGRDG